MPVLQSCTCAQAIWKYDYAGIVVLIVTSFVPPVYYGFLCQPLLRNFYMISTLSLGARVHGYTLQSCVYTSQNLSRNITLLKWMRCELTDKLGETEQRSVSLAIPWGHLQGRLGRELQLAAVP
jgi:hypothetical protein